MRNTPWGVGRGVEGPGRPKNERPPMAAPREPGVMEEAPAEQSSAAAAAQDDQAAALEAAPEVMEEGPAAAVQEEAAGGGALVVEDEENVFLEDEEDWEYDGHGTHGPSPMGVAAASAAHPKTSAAAPDGGRLGTRSKRPASTPGGRGTGSKSPLGEAYRHAQAAQNLIQGTGFASPLPGMSKVEASARLAAVKDLLRSEIDQLSQAVETMNEMDEAEIEAHILMHASPGHGQLAARRGIAAPRINPWLRSPSATGEPSPANKRGFTRSSLKGQARPVSAWSGALHSKNLRSVYGNEKRGAEWEQELSQYEQGLRRSAEVYGVQNVAGQGGRQQLSLRPTSALRSRTSSATNSRQRPASAMSERQRQDAVQCGELGEDVAFRDALVARGQRRQALDLREAVDLREEGQERDEGEDRKDREGGGDSGTRGTAVTNPFEGAAGEDRGRGEGGGEGGGKALDGEVGIATMITKALDAKRRASMFMASSDKFQARSDSFLYRLAELAAEAGYPPPGEGEGSGPTNSTASMSRTKDLMDHDVVHDHFSVSV